MVTNEATTLYGLFVLSAPPQSEEVRHREAFREEKVQGVRYPYPSAPWTGKSKQLPKR